MNSSSAIRELLNRVNISQRKASELLGKHYTFLSATLLKKSDCQCSTIAALAKVCGYKLVLVPLTCENADEIVIDE